MFSIRARVGVGQHKTAESCGFSELLRIWGLLRTPDERRVCAGPGRVDSPPLPRTKGDAHERGPQPTSQ
jgi:hypothetical protein